VEGAEEQPDVVQSSVGADLFDHLDRVPRGLQRVSTVEAAPQRFDEHRATHLREPGHRPPELFLS
jgi:hypothetical protein